MSIASRAPEVLVGKRSRTRRPRLGAMTLRALRLACPLCGKDRPFHGLFRMRPHCRRCGLVYERERGYFLASMDVNFWCTLCCVVPMVLVTSLLTEPSAGRVLGGALVFVTVFPLWFFRYSKAIYLLIDLWLDPPREADFVVRDPHAPGSSDASSRPTARAP